SSSCQRRSYNCDALVDLWSTSLSSPLIPLQYARVRFPPPPLLFSLKKRLRPDGKSISQIYRTRERHRSRFAFGQHDFTEFDFALRVNLAWLDLFNTPTLYSYNRALRLQGQVNVELQS